MSIRKNLLSSAATVLCASTMSFMVPGAAFAQEVEEAEQGGLDVIVVTAQRRDENLQDVPVAVTVADASALADAGVVNVENLNALSPSISFRKTNIASSSSNIQIRGIGTTGNARTFEGAVGVFIDGVYRTRSGMALSNFLDIDNVQILRGPQGTLFGKNTSAGAILVNSTLPDVNEFGGNVEASYGNYESYLLRGAVNVPFSEKAALRVAGVVSGTEGNFKNPNGGNLNGTDDWGVKAQLLIEPSDGITLQVIADYSESEGDCCYGTFDAIDGPLQPFIDGLSLAAGLTPPSGDISARQATVNPATINKVSDYGLAIKASFEIGNGSLNSVTAIREFDLFQLQDADFSGADILDLDETFNSQFISQELTYNGEIDGAITADFVIGGFYSDERLRMSRDLRWGTQAQSYWDAVFGASAVPAGTANAAPGLAAQERMEGTAKSLAVFTHWNVDLSDQFSVVLGARYTNERKSGAFVQRYFRDALFDPLALAGAQPGIPYDLKTTDNALSGTVGLQYRPADDVMIYATYNRGFKAGGVNLDVNAGGTPGSLVFGTPGTVGSPIFRPEKIDGFELGAKVDWMDHRARTNIAFFYNKITDLQVAQFLGLQFNIVNSPKAIVYGAEIEQTFELTDGVIFNGGLTWLPEANFGNDPVLGFAIPADPLAGGVAGRRFSSAPELAANAALSGEFPVSDNLAIHARVQGQYNSEVFTNTTSNLIQDSVFLVNANLGLATIDDGWDISGWVQNLFDKDYISQHFSTPLQGTDRNAYLGAPRTYGLTLRGSF